MTEPVSATVLRVDHADLIVGHQEVAPPADGEMMLQVLRSGICGTDLFKLSQAARAGAAAVDGHAGSTWQGAVLGHEIVGRVQASGPGCRFAPGSVVAVPHHVACADCRACRRGASTQCPAFRDNLLNPGGFSSHVLVDRRAVEMAARQVPEALPWEAAVFLEPGGCVVRSVRQAGLGEPAHSAAPTRVLILGAGSMGLLHLLMLRALDLDLRVTVVDPLEERRRLAAGLGADVVASPDDSVEACDVAFDTVGGGAVLRQALRSLCSGGTVVLFAHAMTDDSLALPINDLFRHEQRIVSSYSGSLAEQDVAWRLLTSGRLDPTPLVSDIVGFDQANQALERLRNHNALKILLAPGQSIAA